MILKLQDAAMNILHLQSDCGCIKGEVGHVAHSNCNHVAPYCNNIQEFTRHLCKVVSVLKSWSGI